MSEPNPRPAKIYDSLADTIQQNLGEDGLRRYVQQQNKARWTGLPNQNDVVARKLHLF